MYKQKFNEELLELIDEGSVFLELKQYTSAINYFNKALKFCPSQSFILLNKLKCLKKHDINDFKKLIELSDDKLDDVSELFNIKGTFYLYLDDYEQACDCFDKVLNIDSRNIYAIFSKGLCILDCKDSQKINNYIDFIKEIETNDIYLNLFKGKYFNSFYRFHDSLDVIDKVLEVDLNNPEALIIKAYALFKLDKFEEAIKFIDKAIGLVPDYSILWNLKAICSCELEKSYDEVIKCFNKSIECNPHDDKMWFDKGFYLLLKGKISQSKTCFNKAFDINPQSQGIEDLEGLFAMLDMLEVIHEKI